MRALATLAAFLCIGGQSTATRQEKNVVVIEGRQYFSANGPTLRGSFPGVDVPTYYRTSTANTRGFRASWAIIEKHLYLIGIEAAIEKDDPTLVGSNRSIPGLKYPAFAEGFSGSFSFRARHDDYEELETRRWPIETITLTFKRGVLVRTVEKPYPRE